jgi:hypothetical protein
MNDVRMITLLLPYKIIFYKQTPIHAKLGFTVKKSIVLYISIKNRFLLEHSIKFTFVYYSLLCVLQYNTICTICTLYNPFVVIWLAKCKE